MEKFRKVPGSGYGSGKVSTSLLPGILLILVGLFLMFVSFAISSAIDFKEIGFPRSFSVVVGAALILFGFLGLGEGVSFSKAKSHWFGSARKAQTDIVISYDGKKWIT